jgi:hypothetical protein
MEKATVIEQITRTLAPYLGATMAEASTRAHCEKLGINGQAIDEIQVQALVGKLGSGLAVFIGRDKAAGVVEEIRRALAAGGAR